MISKWVVGGTMAGWWLCRIRTDTRTPLDCYLQTVRGEDSILACVATHCYSCDAVAKLQATLRDSRCCRPSGQLCCVWLQALCP